MEIAGWTPLPPGEKGREGEGGGGRGEREREIRWGCGAWEHTEALSEWLAAQRVSIPLITIESWGLYSSESVRSRSKS